ncbi:MULTISPECIES: ethanolamine ammonia-lyase light chain EutC [unclassified Sutcliffiella]|uniref:ethanolamine ammonia-lyase light chain EutC n=1 Tax=Sutcliffiella sp. FSL R7-0096 TaxID=2921670 RepID=UPI0030D4DA59
MEPSYASIKSRVHGRVLNEPGSGRKLSAESFEWAKANLAKGKQVQIIVSDGLSSTGI